MVAKNFLWILSLNAIFLIGKVKEIDSSGTASSVTGVEADLDALNTTALQLIWDSKQKPANVSIEYYEIKIGNETLVVIASSNETDSYSYTITGGEPGANYTVTLIVSYATEIQVAKVAQDTTVSVPDTTTTSALPTDSSTTTVPELRQWVIQQESIHLFNNTYPATPTNVNLTGRDKQSLTFSWYQEGKADSCYIWSDNASTTDCSSSNEEATGTISGLPVAGRQYTVHIVSISGGLRSDIFMISDRTLPPNPSAPQCMSKTTTSLTLLIPTPYQQPPGVYELDEYEVIIKSLIYLFPYNTTRLEGASGLVDILVTIDGLVAGVTYNITLTTRVANVSSAGSNSTNCVTELNVPLINNVINTTETTVKVVWQTPFGYYEGFNVSCTGQNSTKNASTIHNLTSSNTSLPLNAECHSVTAGALYEVNVASLLFHPSSTSNVSESVFNATVPYAPKEVLPWHATTDLIQITVAYGYNVYDSQCTHFEVTDLAETGTIKTVPANDPVVIFSPLTADKSYNFSTYAVSNYTQSSSYLWRRSSNSTATSAWTLAPSVSNVTELERGPWSLLVQFDQSDPHDHVWQYVVHVNTTSGRISTINLMCQDVPMETLTTFNCETNSDVPTNYSTTCRTKTPCTAATEIPASTQVKKVVSVTSFKGAITGIPQEVTGPTGNASKWDAAKISEDGLPYSTAQSICFNISSLEPYISYFISVQAVNPGGCSVTETVVLRTAEWIPGCVNITYFNESYDSIEVHWNPPDKPNGIIIQYVIGYTKQDSDLYIAFTKDTFFILQQLQPFVEYNITVAAATRVGVGVSGCPLSTISAKTKIGKPYEPILAVYALSATSINISWTLTRDLKTGPETYYNLTITDTDNATWIIKEHVEGFYNRSIVVEGLDEYWEYRVAIVAYTIDDNGQELTTEGGNVTIRTLESTPGPVQFFNVTSLYSMNKCYLARIAWHEPTKRDLNGEIRYYHLRWSRTGDSYFDSQNFSVNPTTADVSVEPNDQTYTFTIMAATSVGLGIPFDYFLESTGFCRPAPLIVDNIFGESSEYSPTQTSFTVLYDPTVFEQNDNGPVIASALLVAEVSYNLNETEEYGDMGLFDGALTWSEAVEKSPILEYRPTPDTWLNDRSGSPLSRQSRTLSAKYVVGKDDTCTGTESSYCNGPLPSNRQFRVRGVICTQVDQCYKTPLLGVPFITAISDTAEDLAWIAGVMIGVLALIALIVFLLYFFVYRKRRNGSFRESSDSDKEMDLHFSHPPEENLHVSAAAAAATTTIYSNRVEKNSENKQKHKTKTKESSDSDKEMDRHFTHPPEEKEYSDKPIDLHFTLPPEEKAKPIRTVDFPARVAEMHRNSDSEFNDEYQSIQTESARLPWTAAEQPKNRVKNRFVNILPFDHSRVALRTTDNDDEESESDYINANYIPSGLDRREYIAAQGPLHTTLDDFWNMIWQEKSTVIVMLTNLKENGRVKCEQYWPKTLNETIQFGHVSVTMTNEQDYTSYFIRHFTAKVKSESRHVKQFHFVAWPDFGVPAQPQLLVDCIRAVRECIGQQIEPPTVVHCSAGVGQTGTFIALDRLLRQVNDATSIDVFGTVLQLREFRCQMVQTETQYIFIHDCMSLEIERLLNPESTYEDVYNDAFEVNSEPLYANENQIKQALNNGTHSA